MARHTRLACDELSTVIALCARNDVGSEVSSARPIRSPSDVG